MLNPWLTLSFKAFQLGIKSQSVVALRMMRTRVRRRWYPGRNGPRDAGEGCSYCGKLNLLPPRRLSPGIRIMSSRERHLRSSENECAPTDDGFPVAKSHHCCKYAYRKGRTLLTMHCFCRRPHWPVGRVAFFFRTPSFGTDVA